MLLVVEDFASTNELIRRASQFKTDHGFLVKPSKHGQNYKFQVATFGRQSSNNPRKAMKHPPPRKPQQKAEVISGKSGMPFAIFSVREKESQNYN
jgi:hypothetical protein